MTNLPLPSRNIDVSPPQENEIEKYLDMRGDNLYTPNMHKDLIALLRERIDFHRGQIQKYEAALMAAEGDHKSAQSKPIAVKVRGTVNKSAFVRGIISSGNGVTPAEIRAQAQEQLGPMSANFPYALLGKMIERGQVKKELGKYYPTAKTKGD